MSDGWSSYRERIGRMADECARCATERTDLRWWCYRVRQALARFEAQYSSQQLADISTATWNRTDDEWQRLFWESIDPERSDA